MKVREEQEEKEKRWPANFTTPYIRIPEDDKVVLGVGGGGEEEEEMASPEFFRRRFLDFEGSSESEGGASEVVVLDSEDFDIATMLWRRWVG